MEDAVTPKELEPWLRQALRTQIVTVEKDVQKTRNDVQSQIGSLKEIVSILVQKSERDSAEKKDNRAVYKAARALNRMCLELQDLLSAGVPENAESYEGLKQFSDVTARLATDARRIRDKWIRYIRPYYILDTMTLNASIDKFRRLGDQTWAVLSKDGGLLRGLEEIRSRVAKIQDLEASLRKQADERDLVIEEIKKLDPRILEVERQIESLAVNPKIAELKKIDGRLTQLRGDLLSIGFRRLGRPMRRLEAIASRGEYPVAPEVRERLSAYLKRPFTTFTSEEEGYPALKSVLRSMRGAVERKKLVLKQREERKVIERIDNVTEKDALDRVHREAAALMSERQKHFKDPEWAELVARYKDQKKSLRDLRSMHEDLERQSKRLSEKVETLGDSLSQYVKETGRLAEKLAKKPVRLETESPSPVA